MSCQPNLTPLVPIALPISRARGPGPSIPSIRPQLPSPDGIN